MEYLKDKKILLIIALILIGITTTIIISSKKENKSIDNKELVFDVSTTYSKSNNKIYVDIKGEVKKPGVYEFKENDRVIDAIKISGGLTKNANTNNINLSQKLTNEMVVYVSNKKDLKKTSICSETCKTEIIEVNNCVEEIKKSNLININNATKEDLMTIEGIGESKANNIIKYREENGLFESIDSIKNVSGIGETIFNSIKDNITI